MIGHYNFGARRTVKNPERGPLHWSTLFHATADQPTSTKLRKVDQLSDLVYIQLSKNCKCPLSEINIPTQQPFVFDKNLSYLTLKFKYEHLRETISTLTNKFNSL